MTIHFAADHAGFELKEELMAFVENELGYSIEDHGAVELDPADDYPDFVIPAVKALAASPNDRAIIIGGSGQGEAMAANRLRGIRAAVYYGGPREIISLSREHNDANTLSLGARFISASEAKEAVKLWLDTYFSSEERHYRRVSKLDL